MELIILHTSGFFLSFFVFIALCLLFDKIATKKPTQPSKEDRFQVETFSRLTAISNQLADIKANISAIENEVCQNAGDMEALRRKLHELTGDVKRIGSVFAVIPVAEVVND
jgi:peptidoglycan hydrolase CwlO-like protein